ncbi:hypothetical protein ABE493_07840 [Stenotrophomonas terrae]|uniref:hypothetical protein n=1 Tax=Stenotrophomonas terrae TaxID=405446 RepID=UPI00320AA3EE
MNALLAKLTVKPLLCSIVALLLLVVVLAVCWGVDARTSTADLTTAQAAADVATTQMQSARARVQELTDANVGWRRTAGVLQAELKAAQEQVVTIRKQSEAAIVAAQARERDANQVLETFMARYAEQVKAAACAQALTNVEAVCPAFRGY